MKNFKNILVVLVLVLFSSCTNENEQLINDEELNISYLDKSSIELMSFEDKLRYKEHHLKEIGKWFGANLSNQQFKNRVVGTSKDQEFTRFYIKDFISSLNEKNIKTKQSEAFEVSLNAFVDIENESWYPAIQKINKGDDRKSSGVNTLYIIEQPELENQETTVFPVYYYDTENDDLLLYDDSFTRNQTIPYDVYVITIGGGGGGGSGGGSGSSDFDRIVEMRVKQHKEDWHNGASEVHMVGFRTIHNPQFSGDCGLTIPGGGCEEDGRRIRKVKRNDIGDLFNPNYLVNGGNNSFPNTGILSFIIFEQDPFPAPTRCETFNFSNNTFRNVCYRSYQSYYSKSQAEYEDLSDLPQVSNYTFENSGIYFRMNP